MRRRPFAAALAALCLPLSAQEGPKAKTPTANHLLPLRQGRVDAVSGELSLALPMGPRLPGRIPLGFSWRFRSQFPLTQNGNQGEEGSPLGGTLLPVVWCAMPAYTHDLDGRIPEAAHVTVQVEGEAWTFHAKANPAQAHPDADVLNWLRERFVADGALPRSTADFQLFKVLPNTDGGRVLVRMRWSATEMLAIIDGPTAIWTQDGATSHFSNRWKDHVIVRHRAGHPGAPTSMEIVNARDESAYVRMTIEEGTATTGFHFRSLPIQVRISNGFGLPEARAAGLCRQEERVAHITHREGHAVQVHSGTWNWGFFPDTITHAASDGSATTTTLTWLDGECLHAISHPGGLGETFTWDARCDLSARAYHSQNGYWIGYKPDNDTGEGRATESIDHAPNVERQGVASITRSGAGVSDKTVIRVAMPKGRYLLGRFQWNLSAGLAHITTILNYGTAEPGSWSPVRGLRLTHAPLFDPGESGSMQGYLFATSAILKSEAFTGLADGSGNLGGQGEPYQTSRHEDWTVACWANPRGELSRGLPMNPVARTTRSSSSDLPGIETVTRSDRADPWGPTRSEERTGPLTKTATWTRHFDFRLGQLLTDSETRTLGDRSEPPLRIQGASIDLGTTTYQHDSLGRLTATRVQRGDFVETEKVTYAEGLPVVTARSRGVTREGAAVPANRDLSGVSVGSESVPDDTPYAWPSRARELPDGRWTIYAERDALGRELERIDPGGLGTRTEYDAWGRVALKFLKDRNGDPALTSEYLYDPDGRWQKETVTPKGGSALTTLTRFDALGRTIQTVLPDGSTQTTTYDGWGQKSAQTPVQRPDETCGAESWIYDERGRLQTHTDAQGRKLAEVLVQPILKRSEAGIGNGIWKTVLDAQGQPRTEVHDLLGQKVALIDQLGQTSRYRYDQDGRLAEVARAEQKRSYHYNRLGWLEAKSDPEEGLSVFSEHNLQGVPAKVTRKGLSGRGEWTLTTLFGAWLEPRSLTAKGPEGTVTRDLDYDDQLHLPTRIAESQPGGSLRETFSYDALLQRTGKTVSDGSQTFQLSRSLDALGRTLSLSYPGLDGSAQVVTTSYDSAGRPVQVALNGEARGRMAYGRGEGRGHADRLTLGNQASSTSTWSRGELANVTHTVRSSDLADNRQSNDYTWLASGLLAKRGPDEFAYDQLQRLKSARTAGLAAGETITQTFGYDAYGNRASSQFTYQGDTQPEEVMAWTARYERNNQLPGRVTGPAGDLTTGAVYDDLGRLTSVLAIPNNFSRHPAAWGYDPSGRVIEESVDAVLTSFLLDCEGLRFRSRKADGAVTYTVYGFEREPLARFEPAPPPANLWTQDRNVRLRVPESGWIGSYHEPLPCLPGEVFHGHALLRTGAMASGSAHLGLRFDSATATGLGWATAAADGAPQGSRSAEPVRLACTGTVPAGASKVLLYVECGEATPDAAARFDEIAFSKGVAPLTTLARTRLMVYGFGQLLSEETPAGPRYLQTDQVGSPNLLTDADGKVVGRSKNLPFGERIGQTGEKSFRRYTNHEDQPGSAIYMQARIYLPGYGRFAQVDPAYDQVKGDPESWNLYAYVRNNPVTHTDPDGRQAKSGAALTPAEQQRRWNRTIVRLRAVKAGIALPQARPQAQNLPGATPGTGTAPGRVAGQASAPQPGSGPKLGSVISGAQDPKGVAGALVAGIGKEGAAQTSQGVAVWPSNFSLGIGIEYEVGFGKRETTHGLVGGSLALTNSGGQMLPNGLSAQANTGVPGPSTVYGMSFSIGKTLSVGNAGNASALGGTLYNASVTLGLIKLTYGTDGSGGKQYSAGLAVGLSFSRYTTCSSSGSILGP